MKKIITVGLTEGIIDDKCLVTHILEKTYLSCKFNFHLLSYKVNVLLAKFIGKF